jgi:hypothetical protein
MSDTTDDARSGTAIERNEDFEASDSLEAEYKSTLRQTVKILEDDEDRPEGIFLSIHRGDGVAFTTGMAPELVDGVGPTLPAVEMLAQHIDTVHQQTQGMSRRELAALAANYSERMGDSDV